MHDVAELCVTLDEHAVWVGGHVGVIGGEVYALLLDASYSIRDAFRRLVTQDPGRGSNAYPTLISDRQRLFDKSENQAHTSNMGDNLQQMIDTGEEMVRKLRILGDHQLADELEADIEAVKEEGPGGVFKRAVTR